MAEYELLPTQSEALDVTERDAASLYGEEPEVCGAELTTGGTCDRPAGECQYHD